MFRCFFDRYCMSFLDFYNSKKSESCRLLKPKNAQVTLFVILAILIVGGVIAYFSLRTGIKQEIPQNMKPVYNHYLSCLEEHARQGIALLGEQGGRIKIPDFIPGSQYMPFSSQLDFFGQPIPYWMYVSGNNLLKEQVPSKSDMERELEEYVKERLVDCDFSDFAAQGFNVVVGGGEVKANINELDVELDINNPIVIYFDNQSVLITNHKINLKSKLGKFYDMAIDVYNFEKKNMFLEKYALDVMRLYAPVSGIEITCSPKVFVKEKIREDLVKGLESNIGMLKLKGSYYDLKSKDHNYFVVDIGRDFDEKVNFIYSSTWPSRIEIYGDTIVEPVGLQEGMGILGFCYVPYHFVYDIDFPVLIQFYDNEEIFQFPIAVVIDKNQARKALPTSVGVSIEPEICKYKNQNISIYTYDLDLNPVEANIKFKCLNTECRIGKTKLVNGDAVFEGSVPQCVNGFILASAEGYAPAKYQISTNEESVANVVLRKLYDVNLSLSCGGKNVGKALVSFTSDDYSTTIVYPDMKNVKLIEGQYKIKVYVYRNSSLKFPATSTRKCVEVPKGGILGLVGEKEEKCFDINIPETEVGFVVIGGGEANDYFTEQMLRDKKLNINVPLFKTPENLREVQENYIKVESSSLDLKFE